MATWTKTSGGVWMAKQGERLLLVAGSGKEWAWQALSKSQSKTGKTSTKTEAKAQALAAF